MSAAHAAVSAAYAAVSAAYAVVSAVCVPVGPQLGNRVTPTEAGVTRVRHSPRGRGDGFTGAGSRFFRLGSAATRTTPTSSITVPLQNSGTAE